MDYGKLTKNQLIKLCEAKKLSFSSSWTKEKIEELLIKNDKNNQKSFIDKKSNSNKIGKVGSIINIVSSSFFLISSTFLLFILLILSKSILIIITLPILIIVAPIFVLLIIGIILTIVSNYRYYKGKNNKVMAGILGLIFSGIIGGILVLLGD